MRLGIAVPERHVDAPVLDAALEATTRLDEAMLARGAPTLGAARGKVRWRPEPPGQEHFDHLGEVLRRGWGDCDDLAPWHAASLRHSGADPGARARVYRSGPRRWHAVVQRSDGRVDDPSKALGMGPGVAPGVAGAAYEPLVGGTSIGAYAINPKLAVRPTPQGLWEARADLPLNLDFIPWHRELGETPEDVAMALLHQAPVAHQAIAGVCCAGSDLADDEDVANYLQACALYNMGATPEEVAEICGEEAAGAAANSVGAIWDKVADVAKKVVKPIVKSDAAKFASVAVPGGPAAWMAMKGGLSAAEAKGGVFKKARGAFGGAARGAVDYFDNPMVKVARKALPFVEPVASKAEDFARMASKIDREKKKKRAKSAVKQRSRGRKGGGKSRKVSMNRGGSGIREVIVRA